MKKTPVAVLISGSGSNLQALIDASLAPDYPAEIVLVVSNKDEAYGLKRAQEAGIDTQVVRHKDYADRESFDLALFEAIASSGAQFVCLAGFMRILTPEFVEQWEGHMINIHPSLLPSFKGVNTHKAVLESGAKIHGCTVHYVVPEMDSGPIIIQAAVPVLAGDIEQTLAARVLNAEHIIYPLALAKALVPEWKADVADASQLLISF